MRSLTCFLNCILNCRPFTIGRCWQDLHMKTVYTEKTLLSSMLRIFQHSLRSQSLSFQFTSVFWDHRSGKAPGIFVSGLCGIFGHYRKVFLRFTDECFGGSQCGLQVRFYFTVNPRFLRTANLWTVLWIFSWNFCRQFFSCIWKKNQIYLHAFVLYKQHNFVLVC